MSNEQSPPPRKVVPYRSGKRVTTFRRLDVDFAGTALEQALLEQLKKELPQPSEDPVPYEGKTGLDFFDGGDETPSDESQAGSASPTHNPPPTHPAPPPPQASSKRASSIVPSSDRARSQGASSSGAGSQSQLAGSQLSKTQQPETFFIDWRTTEHSRIPQVVFDEILPTLPPMAQTPYMQLLRLTLGFQRRMCRISIENLAVRCNQSVASIKRQLSVLEKRGLLTKVAVKFGGSDRGTYLAPEVPGIHSEKKDDQLTQSQLTRSQQAKSQLPERHMKRNHEDHDHEIKDHHRNAVMRMYQGLTGNAWTRSDEAAHEKIRHIPEGEIEELMRTIQNRAAEPIGSMAYFAKAILAERNNDKPQGKAALRKKLEKLALEIRNAHVGDANYRITDLMDDLKIRCLQEGLFWNNDVVNDILGI